MRYVAQEVLALAKVVADIEQQYADVEARTGAQAAANGSEVSEADRAALSALRVAHSTTLGRLAALKDTQAPTPPAPPAVAGAPAAATG